MRSGQLHREISFGHLRITVPSLLHVFLWVWHLHREGQGGNHGCGAMHRLDPVPTSLSWCIYRFHQSPPQTEAPRLVSASSTPVPPGHWEWSVFYKKTLPQKPSVAEVNQSYFFTPEWKYIASISFIFQRKYVTFDTAIKSKFSNLLTLGCNPVSPGLP